MSMTYRPPDPEVVSPHWLERGIEAAERGLARAQRVAAKKLATLREEILRENKKWARHGVQYHLIVQEYEEGIVVHRAASDERIYHGKLADYWPTMLGLPEGA